MRFALYLALLLFVTLGCLHTASSDVATYNVDVGWHSMTNCDIVYQAYLCDGILDLFTNHPIPIGAIDEANGREIMGYEIICDDQIILIGGVPDAPPEDTRDVPRGFGTIKLRYAPLPPPPPPK